MNNHAHTSDKMNIDSDDSKNEDGVNHNALMDQDTVQTYLAYMQVCNTNVIKTHGRVSAAKEAV